MLPAAASLQKQGANKGATTAFLISTPESGVDSIAVTYALLDPIMTVIRPLAAFITAMFAGLLENILNWRSIKREHKIDLSCTIDQCCDGVECPPEVHRKHHSYWEKLYAGWKFAINDVWGDIVLWFFVGIFIAGLITAVVPSDLFSEYLGGGFSSMLLMLVIGIPLYICATASTPVAAALILKGVSPGAALVFLLVGPATNITSLSVLFKILGKWSTVRYLLVLSISAIFFGLGVDAIYFYSGISPKAIIGEAGEIVPLSMKIIASLILILISIKPLYSWLRTKLSNKKSGTQFVSDFPPISKSIH